MPDGNINILASFSHAARAALRCAGAALQWAARNIRRAPKTELWLWPILEVVFITIFSLAPLLMEAASRSLKSDKINLINQLNGLLAGGQLMYYALGFVATAAWLIFVDIRRPKFAIPLLGLLVLFVVIGVAITIGTDPLAKDFNRDAFRSASYWVFFAGLFTYFVTTVLKAWQPRSLEQATRQGEMDLIDEVTRGRQ